MKNIDTVTIADLTQFKDDKASGDSDFMTDSGATAIEQSSTKIGNDDKTKIVDFTNITEEQAQELALYNLQVVNAIRKQLGLPELELNTGSMKAAQDQMDKYVARNKNILTDGHLPGDYFGENGGPIALAKYGTSLTMAEIKQNIYDIVMTQAFADAPSNWGHSNNIQKQVSDFGVSFGIIAGELYSINVFGIYTGTPITNPNDPATLQAALATKKAALDTAKADLAQAQAVQASKATALDAAKVELTKQETTLASLNKDKTALLAEKDRLVEEAKALAAELKGYLEASTKLEEAKTTLSDKKATLKEAIAKAKVANNALNVVNAKLNEAKAKLTELQAEYNKLKDLEDKAKDNVIATLPDGTIVAVPKEAPTVEEKPVLTLSTKKADTPTKTGNNTNQAGITVTQTASGEKVTYSRVARAKALPQTGEQESILGLVGLAMMSTLGLAGARRKRRG